MGHADKISTRDTYKISGQNVSACLVETSPRAWCYPAWAEPQPRALPSHGWHLLLSNAMSFCPTEAVSLHHHFFVVCFDCTMRTAREIVRRLQLRMHFNGQQSCRNPLMLTPVWANCSCPLTEPGLLCLFFSPKSFQNQLIVLKEEPWTGLKW